MWFVFVIPGLGRNEEEISTSSKKKKSRNPVTDIAYIIYFFLNELIYTMCKAPEKSKDLIAKMHPYYKVGFLGVFLMNGHYEDNINPALVLLREKIQM